MTNEKKGDRFFCIVAFIFLASCVCLYYHKDSKFVEMIGDFPVNQLLGGLTIACLLAAFDWFIEPFKRNWWRTLGLGTVAATLFTGFFILATASNINEKAKQDEHARILKAVELIEKSKKE